MSRDVQIVGRPIASSMTKCCIMSDRENPPTARASLASTQVGDNPKIVLQIGPAPGTSGGIAAVIEETLKFESALFEQQACPSWEPNSKFASLATAARTAIKMCGSARRWTVAHVHLSEYGSFIREGFLLVLSKILRKPTVVTLHGADLAKHVAKYPLLSKYVLNRADLVLCLGKNHAKIVSAIADTATQVVANPLSSEAFLSVDGAPPQREASPTFLFAGEVGTRKGHDRLINAWPAVHARFPDANLLIAGPLANGYSVTPQDGIIYLGNLTREALREKIATATAVVLPSRAEVLPMALIESHAQGTPTVYTKVGEWQVFKNAPGMRLVDTDLKSESEIATSLADALIDCASDCHDYRTELTGWARKTFSSDVVSAQLDEAYDRVVSKRVGGFRGPTLWRKIKTAIVPATPLRNGTAQTMEGQ